MKLVGFTLFEILIVFGIIAILAGFLLSIGLAFYTNQQLEAETQTMIQTLRRAQAKAMAIEQDSSFGVYLTNDNYTLFKGNSYLTRDTIYDEVFNLAEIITLSGPSEIVFSKFEGRPNITGNIILTSSGQTRTININEMGRINEE